MKAYKVFDENFKCRDMQYVVGKTYELTGKLQICKNGYHACTNLLDCFNYYSFDKKNKIAEVEMLGDIASEEGDTKIATNKIKIIREITWEEALIICNSGNRNSGNRNSGNRNSGNRNSGNRNSGNWNSGNWNSGNWNSGDWNSGNWNSGDWNSGNRNSGNRNSGDWNSGDWNSGDCNSGGWNSGDCNSGVLNTNNPEQYRVFNKFISKQEYKNIYFPRFMFFDLTSFIGHDTATPEEQEKYKKEIETCGGFLKTFTYKEAFKKSWLNADKNDRMKIKNIPGFDKDLFFEISGIDVDKD